MQQICPEMLPAETQELVKVTPNDNFLALIYSVLCDHKNLCPYGDTAEHVYMFKSCHIQIWMHQGKTIKKLRQHWDTAEHVLRYEQIPLKPCLHCQLLPVMTKLLPLKLHCSPRMCSNYTRKCGALRVLSDWVQLSRIYEYLRSMSLAPFEYLLVF